MLKDAWFRNKPAMNRPHVFPQFMFRFVPTVALTAGDSSGFWLCHERIPPGMFAGLRIDKRCDFSQDTPDSVQMESIIQAVDKCYERAKAEGEGTLWSGSMRVPFAPSDSTNSWFQRFLIRKMGWGGRLVLAPLARVLCAVGSADHRLAQLARTFIATPAERTSRTENQQAASRCSQPRV